MTAVPPYELVLTGGSEALVPLPPDQLRYFAAVSDTNPPKTAIILFTPLEQPARYKAQLRENLKREGIPIIAHHQVTPEELERVYSTARHERRGNASVDIDYEKYRDDVLALLHTAVLKNASDIHIVRRRRSARVSFRINGQLQHRSEWSDEEADSTCRFIYEILAQDQAVTWNPREPQDAVIDTSLSSGERVRVRVGTIPASPDGYDMVLRVLPGAGESLPLQDLGYTPDQLSEIRKLARRPSGLVLMAGGVGSGKSTSLIGMLLEELEVHDQKLRIITVEDPPERVIPNATQVPVVRKQGSNPGDEFNSAIRGALRCDPDTLMVGEIRDRQAAELVIKFAQSGHRVYTTVHAASALGVVARLVAIGIDPASLCAPDVLKGMIFQTLVPVLCKNCKGSISDPNALATLSPPRRECIDRLQTVLAERDLSASEVAVRGPGCEACSQSAITGRTLIPEIVIPDDEMLRYLAQGDQAAAHDHWLSNGGQPIIEHGLDIIVNGRSAPYDVESRIGELDALLVPVRRSTNGTQLTLVSEHD